MQSVCSPLSALDMFNVVSSSVTIKTAKYGASLKFIVTLLLNAGVGLQQLPVNLFTYFHVRLS